MVWLVHTNGKIERYYGEGDRRLRGVGKRVRSERNGESYSDYNGTPIVEKTLEEKAIIVQERIHKDFVEDLLYRLYLGVKFNSKKFIAVRSYGIVYFRKPVMVDFNDEGEVDELPEIITEKKNETRRGIRRMLNEGKQLDLEKIIRRTGHTYELRAVFWDGCCKRKTSEQTQALPKQNYMKKLIDYLKKNC